MSAKTSIEWTESTWTPIRARRIELQSDGSGKERVGWHCEHASPGCVECYAEKINVRLGTGRDFKPVHLVHKTPHGDTRGDVSMFLDENMLLQPLRWSRGRMVFPCSMTDLWGGFVETRWIDRVFAVMALTRRHTYQCLTKRADRLHAYMNDPETRLRVIMACGELAGEASKGGDKVIASKLLTAWNARPFVWPLPNVWLGVSVEDQQRANERVPQLLDTPAALRWVSAEPLIEAVDFCRLPLRRAIGDVVAGTFPANAHLNALRGYENNGVQTRVNWVVVGGESGNRARAFVLGWGKDIVRQCAAMGVPVLVKQIGACPTNREGVPHPAKHPKGGDMAEWPEILRVREYPEVVA